MRVPRMTVHDVEAINSRGASRASSVVSASIAGHQIERNDALAAFWRLRVTMFGGAHCPLGQLVVARRP